MDTRADPTPFDQKLFLIFIVTFATMTAFEFAGQFIYPYDPDWRSNLITSLFTSGLAVIIAYFPLNSFYEKNTQLLAEVERRHGVEKELREREERLKRTFDQSPVGAAIISPDLHITKVNNALCSITGYTSDELLFRSLLSLFSPEESKGVLAYADDLKNKAIDMDERDIQLVRKDHTRIWVRQSVRLIRDAEGVPLYFFPLFIDINDRRIAEDALKRTNKKLSMLSTITRHDIKNQLTGFVGYLQLVSEEAPDDPSLHAHINKLMECSDSINRQIDFTRSSEDPGRLRAEWYEIQEGILDAAGQLSLDGITLDPGRAGISIYADPLINKVYYNILENSIRHGGHVTAITVTEVETDNGLVIRYSDNGVGIPESEKEHIFSQGHGYNTGLGLFLIREILATTGITITETGTPGTGARFEILIPKGTYRFS
ncbi:MAG: PAS domain S-box protein [Methanoregula sp.]